MVSIGCGTLCVDRVCKLPNTVSCPSFTTPSGFPKCSTHTMNIIWFPQPCPGAEEPTAVVAALDPRYPTHRVSIWTLLAIHATQVLLLPESSLHATADEDSAKKSRPSSVSHAFIFYNCAWSICLCSYLETPPMSPFWLIWGHCLDF